MGTGYTRNDTANNIADGNVINASDLDGEFDAVQAAFNGTTGHSHDGTSGEGPQIATGGLADNAVTTAKITDANVTTAKIADSNVTTAKIANSNVTLAKMAANSVDSDQYVDGSIDTAHIADDAVTGDKLANNIQIAGTLGVTGETTLTTHLNMGDNDKIKLGAGSDLHIYHSGSNSFIDQMGVGPLYLRNFTDDQNIFIQTDDGSGGVTTYIKCDGVNGEVSLRHYGSEKLNTTSTGIDVTGVITTDGMTTSADINFGDNDKAVFGAGSDLSVYHDGANSIISEAGTGDIIIYTNGTAFQVDSSAGENMIYAAANSYVQLFYDNAQKFATKSDGVDITGELQADSLDIDGVGNISGTLTMGSNVDFPDGSGTRYGASNDLQIYHDGSDSYVNDVGTGALILKGGTQTKIQASNGENGLIVNDNGAVWLYYDNSTKLETSSSGVTVTGTVTATSFSGDGSSLTGISSVGGATGVDFNDGVKARFGTGNDLEIYHDGSNSYIDDTGVGQLILASQGNGIYIQKSSTETMAQFLTDGAVELYYDNSKKFETTSSGISVTGVTTTNDVTMTSEGGSATTSAKQGSAKCWVAFIGTGTISVSDSFNLSSLSDNTTGTYTANFDNNMSSNEDYCWSFGVKDGNTQGRGRYMNPQNGSTYLTSGFKSEFQNDTTSSMQDVDHGSLIFHGDLA